VFAPLWLISLLAVHASTDVGQDARCKGSAAVVGECFVVHGRLSDWNGNPTLRIWPVGTRRILGVPEGYFLPENVEACVGWDRFQNLYADFLVCPLAPERPGHMRPVCVESATSLVLERYQDATKGTTASVRKLPPNGCKEQ
jgi:hypothetical protein